MLTLDSPPSRLEGALSRIREGLVLSWLAHGFIVAAAAMLTLDYLDLRERAGEALPGSTRLDPLPMSRPSPGDQIRPYLPQTQPLGPGLEAPTLPGLSGPADNTRLAGRMSFHADGAGNVSAVGRIEPGTAEEFSTYLSSIADSVSTVYLHSPGGSVRDAIIMATEIRELGFATVVPANGYCASACPLVLAGGVERQAHESAWVGVHQVYAEQGTVGGHREGMVDAQEISAMCQQHLADMGVEPELWIKAMRTAPEQLYVLTPEEMAEHRLALAAD